MVQGYTQIYSRGKCGWSFSGRYKSPQAVPSSLPPGSVFSDSPVCILVEIRMSFSKESLTDVGIFVA